MRSAGRVSTGKLAEQRIRVIDAQGEEKPFRRIRLKLDQATRDGEKVIHILTNLPNTIRAKTVAEIYRKRWTIDIYQPYCLLKSVFQFVERLTAPFSARREARYATDVTWPTLGDPHGPTRRFVLGL